MKGARMECFLGMITLFPYNFTPRNWVRCDGRVLPIESNQALFALLGTQFGGDGMTNFAVPKLEGPASDINYYIATQGIFPQRD